MAGSGRRRASSQSRQAGAWARTQSRRRQAAGGDVEQNGSRRGPNPLSEKARIGPQPRSAHSCVPMQLSHRPGGAGGGACGPVQTPAHARKDRRQIRKKNKKTTQANKSQNTQRGDAADSGRVVRLVMSTRAVVRRGTPRSIDFSPWDADSAASSLSKHVDTVV